MLCGVNVGPAAWSRLASNHTAYERPDYPAGHAFPVVAVAGVVGHVRDELAVGVLEEGVARPLGRLVGQPLVDVLGHVVGDAVALHGAAPDVRIPALVVLLGEVRRAERQVQVVLGRALGERLALVPEGAMPDDAEGVDA